MDYPQPRSRLSFPAASQPAFLKRSEQEVRKEERPRARVAPGGGEPAGTKRVLKTLGNPQSAMTQQSRSQGQHRPGEPRAPTSPTRGLASTHLPPPAPAPRGFSPGEDACCAWQGARTCVSCTRRAGPPAALGWGRWAPGPCAHPQSPRSSRRPRARQAAPGLLTRATDTGARR